MSSMRYGTPNVTKISCLCRLDCSSFSRPFGSKRDHGNVYSRFQERSKDRSQQGLIPGTFLRAFQGSIPGTILRTFHDFVASFPGHSHLQFLTACFAFAYCKQSKTGGGNGLGTRLQNHGTFLRSFPESILWNVLEIVPVIDPWNILVYVPMIALRSKHSRHGCENEERSSLHKQLIFVAFGVP